MRFIFLALVTAFVVSPSSAQEATPPVVALAPGDLLKIEVWREDDLSGEFQVDEAGMVTLPLLGPRSVVGVPVQELRRALLADYHAQLRNPSIVITPLRRVYILGEVNEPGLLAVDPTITLAGVVALAGGASPQGDLRRIQIFRHGEMVRDKVAATSMLAAVDIHSGDQIFVGRRGWFERNSTFLVSALLSVTSIIITLAR